MYKSVDPKINFPQMEEGILQFWQENRIFEQSLEKRADADEFVFYDGPPFATGLPHFGHFVPGTIKDIIPRYQTMKGKRVERRFGWDCHGLPVEYEVEKELGISGKTAIENFGVAAFNEACRSIVLRYTSQWRHLITRSGRWVNFEHDYKTMDPPYMESIWWAIKVLWEKNLIYKGHYILPTCPRCSTPLSNHELSLGSYKDVQDPAITLRFLREDEEKTYFLAWTTTPWTLVSNLGLSFGPKIIYIKIADKTADCFYILAEERLKDYFPQEDDYEILWKKPGTELLGIPYRPLFPYFAELREKGAFRTFLGDHVSLEDGTGIVHTAPGFGEEDYQVMKNSGVPIVCPVDDEGHYSTEVSDYAGRFVKDCDKDIIHRLKAEGSLIKRTQILHAYPHCWRCESPLIYRAVASWFVKVTAIKKKMIQANKQVHWVPQHLQEGRFGRWLENARDWAISRNRYWGNPLPIWECDLCGAQECLGTVQELYVKIGKEKAQAHKASGGDLHKHHVDAFQWPCACEKGIMHRSPEVLDCWFESGAMPYAQAHYPFENKKWLENHFPADFIAEGLDQTRGWFYTLSVLSSALFERPAFNNVVVNGLVLAEDGKKMSKSLRNYSDPEKTMKQFGADALRLFLMNSAVVKAESLRYSDKGVRDALKGVLLPLWNAYSFFVTYANIDNIHPSGESPSPQNPLDQWILSETGQLIAEVSQQLDSYDIQKSTQPILTFIDVLNNWYIRRSRRRFWKNAQGKTAQQDKREAYTTLHSALLALVQIAAPFIPFVSDEIYRNIKPENYPLSVHLSDWPQAKAFPRNEELERKMTTTRRSVRLGRSLRNSHELKIRQPLKTLYLVTENKDEQKILQDMAELLAEELNVKNIVFRQNEEELVEYSAKANFSVLGRQLGKDMKIVAQRINALKSAEIHSILKGASLSISLADKQKKSFTLSKESLDIRRHEKEGLKVINEGSLTLAFDIELTPALRAEGWVRDLVRGLQNERKEQGFQVTDRITIHAEGPESLREALKPFQDYLLEETLATSLHWGSLNKEEALSLSIGDRAVWVILTKI